MTDQMSLADQKEVLVSVDIARNCQIKLLERVWRSFYNNVDSRDDLEKAAKLTYLLQSLEVEPREMITGLSHMDANYIIAVTALRDRYADPIKQTEVRLQKFFNLPSPRHNAKELCSFLMEYHKVREQMRHVGDFDASALTIRSVLVRKLSYQTFTEICDHVKDYNFSILDMDRALQYIIGNLEHAKLLLGDKTNVKSVGAHSQQDQKQRGNYNGLFCSSNHKAVDYTKYKTIQARKDRVISQRLCFNCLTPGHPSKNCRSKKTYHICHLHHHTSLCNQTQCNQSRGDTSQPSKNNQSSSSSRGSRQLQQHPQSQMKPSQNHQQPVVTQHKSNTQKQHASSTPSTSAHVTNINVSNFPHNVLPIAMLDVSYCYAKTFMRPFFYTDSQSSFVSPELVEKLNLPVIEQVPVHLSTFGNDTTLHFLDLVKIKVQMGKRHIPIKLLVHDSASMGYSNCPGIHNVVRMLEIQGHQLADRSITSDSLTGIELLIGVDYFAHFITRQKRASGVSLFVTRGEG